MCSVGCDDILLVCKWLGVFEMNVLDLFATDRRLLQVRLHFSFGLDGSFWKDVAKHKI